MSSLKETILKVLNKTYAPLSLVETRFKRYDMVFKTDEQGRPVLLFMGEKDQNGRIKGERYARRLLTDADGRVVKDHWDHKGKATVQSFSPTAGTINLERDYELRYWTSQLKVTNDELKEAVAAVGNSIEAVKVYLDKA